MGAPRKVRERGREVKLDQRTVAKGVGRVRQPVPEPVSMRGLVAGTADQNRPRASANQVALPPGICRRIASATINRAARAIMSPNKGTGVATARTLRTPPSSPNPTSISAPGQRLSPRPTADPAAMQTTIGTVADARANPVRRQQSLGLFMAAALRRQFARANWVGPILTASTTCRQEAALN